MGSRAHQINKSEYGCQVGLCFLLNLKYEMESSQRLRLKKQPAFPRCSWLLGVTSSRRPISLCCSLAADRGPLRLPVLTPELQPVRPPPGRRLCHPHATCGCWGQAVRSPPGCNQPPQLAGTTRAAQKGRRSLRRLLYNPLKRRGSSSHLPKDRTNSRSPAAPRVPQIPAPLLCSWDARLLASERLAGTNGNK